MTKDSIEQLLDYHLATGRYPGAVVHVERGGRALAHHVVGRLRGDGDAPMREDAIFRIASLTKPLVSAVALMLVEEGRLGLDAPVQRYLPELANLRLPGGGAARRPPSVRDLLRHTSGFAHLNEVRDAGARGLVARAGLDARLPTMTRDELLAALAGLPLACEPGMAFRYGFSTDVLGLAIERIVGASLSETLRERVFAPLGMRATGFVVPPRSRERFATGLPADRGWFAWTSLFDEGEAAGLPIESGGGGLASTLADYLRFARMLVGGGELDGVRVLGAQSAASMVADQLDQGVDGPANLAGPGFGFGFGLAVRLDWGVSAYPTVAGEATWSGVCGPVMYLHPRERWIAMSFNCNLATRMLARMEFRRAVQPLLEADSANRAQ